MFTEDLSVFFDADDFGTDATYTPSGGSAVTIRVIFDDVFHAVSPQEGEVEVSGPQALARTADVPSAGHSDTLAVHGVTYKVIGVQPDGSGLTLLTLSKD